MEADQGVCCLCLKNPYVLYSLAHQSLLCLGKEVPVFKASLIQIKHLQQLLHEGINTKYTVFTYHYKILSNTIYYLAN